jgi:hypothetical protein
MNQFANHSKLADRGLNRFDRAESAAVILGGTAVWLSPATPAEDVTADVLAHYPDGNCYISRGSTCRAHAGVKLADGRLLGWREACKLAGLYGC